MGKVLSLHVVCQDLYFLTDDLIFVSLEKFISFLQERHVQLLLFISGHHLLDAFLQVLVFLFENLYFILECFSVILLFFELFQKLIRELKVTH